MLQAFWLRELQKKHIQEQDFKMTQVHIKTNINGDNLEFLCGPDETLLDVLRDKLQLTGTKEGCGTGDCGACSITLDGKLVCSCLVLGISLWFPEVLEGFESSGRFAGFISTYHDTVGGKKNTPPHRNTCFFLTKQNLQFSAYPSIFRTSH